MDRIFVSPGTTVSEAPIGEVCAIEGASHRHLAKALRARAGQRVLAVDGAGRETELEIERLERDATHARVIERRMREAGAGRAVTLAVAPPKGDRFDVAVEKACEIGVGRIVPLIADRSVVRLGKDSSRVERWRRIACAAMVQSGQAWLPEIGEPATLDGAIDAGREETPGKRAVLLAHLEPGAATIRAALTASAASDAGFAGREVVVLVGPEGGFTSEEVDRARRAGAIAVSLGRTRLRTETAAVVAAALVVDALELMIEEKSNAGLHLL